MLRNNLIQAAVSPIKNGFANANQLNECNFEKCTCCQKLQHFSNVIIYFVFILIYQCTLEVSPMILIPSDLKKYFLVLGSMFSYFLIFIQGRYVYVGLLLCFFNRNSFQLLETFDHTLIHESNNHVHFVHQLNTVQFKMINYLGGNVFNIFFYFMYISYLTQITVSQI